MVRGKRDEMESLRACDEMNLNERISMKRARPKYVQIDAFWGNSTGSLMRKNAAKKKKEGWESFIFWARGPKTISDHEVNFSRHVSVLAHAMLARITDRAGFYSKTDTDRLCKQLDSINPDVVHLHGLQGYYINLPRIIRWLASHDSEVWITMHDCWLVTGHCPYFEMSGCYRWKTGCYHCPQKGKYPKSVLLDSSKRNWLDKKALISQLNPLKVKIICPSEWMAKIASESFLKRFTIVVEKNEVDSAIFQRRESHFKAELGIGGKHLILGVASPWTERKGLHEFIRLHEKLDRERYAIVCIGLSKKQIKALPNGVIGLPRTESVDKLVEAYSAADVFFNPTLEDNYPTVNLEAQACGVPVVTYRSGGSPETLDRALGSAEVNVKDIEAAADIIERLCEKSTHK